VRTPAFSTQFAADFSVALAEAARVVRAGGHVAICNWGSRAGVTQARWPSGSGLAALTSRIAKFERTSLIEGSFRSEPRSRRS
jgi:ubiquinone/menaquinone biosynthesis C-methylase UbiE